MNKSPPYAITSGTICPKNMCKADLERCKKCFSCIKPPDKDYYICLQLQRILWWFK